MEIVEGFKNAEFELKTNNKDKSYFSLIVNGNTMKCHVKSSVPIDFTPADYIGGMLGFDKRRLESYKEHELQNTFNIFNVNVIKVDCSLVTGSYKNGINAHHI